MSVFNGVLDPDNKEFKYYYPTQDLVTGPDILFFWVARMIIAGYEFAAMPGLRMVVFSLVLILVMLFAREGIFGKRELTDMIRVGLKRLKK